MLDESRACERDANVRVSFADENVRGRSLRRDPPLFRDAEERSAKETPALNRHGSFPGQHRSVRLVKR